MSCRFLPILGTTSVALAGLLATSSLAVAQSNTPAGTPVQGVPVAGSPAQGQTAAGSPSWGQRPAGTPFGGNQPNVVSPSGNPAAGVAFGGFQGGNPNNYGGFQGGYGYQGNPAGYPQNSGRYYGTGNWVGGNDYRGVNNYFPMHDGMRAGGYRPQYGQSQYTPNANAQMNDFGNNPGLGIGRLNSNESVSDNVMRFRIMVPTSAELLINGQKTTPTGSVREFVSPPIDWDREYTYELRARWSEGGRDVVQTRKISFFAGDRLTVKLMTERPEGRVEDTTREGRTSEKHAREDTTSSDRRDVLDQTSFDVAIDESTHDGRIVRITDNQLVMKGQDDKEHKHAMAPGAQITLDNTVAKLESLAPGMQVRVTTKNTSMETALRVEVIERNVNFMKRSK